MLECWLQSTTSTAKRVAAGFGAPTWQILSAELVAARSFASQCGVNVHAQKEDENVSSNELGALLDSREKGMLCSVFRSRQTHSFWASGRDE